MVGEKRNKSSVFKMFSLKMLSRYPRADVKEVIRHTSLEPREKEWAEDTNLEPPRFRC